MSISDNVKRNTGGNNAHLYLLGGNARMITSLAQLPETVQNRLLHLRDSITRTSWQVGDIVNEIFQSELARDPGAMIMPVYLFVAEVVGLSASTVRHHAAAAAFYTPPVREKYDILPHSHFVFALGYKNQFNADGHPTWESILNSSVDYFTRTGRLLSVDRLSDLQSTGQVGSGTDTPTPRLPDRDERVIDSLPSQPTQPDEDYQERADYVAPHPDEDPDPQTTRESRKRRMLEEVRETVQSYPDELARLNARVAEFRGDKQMTWLSGELAQIAERLRVISDSIEAYVE